MTLTLATAKLPRSARFVLDGEMVRARLLRRQYPALTPLLSSDERWRLGNKRQSAAYCEWSPSWLAEWSKPILEDTDADP